MKRWKDDGREGREFVLKLPDFVLAFRELVGQRLRFVQTASESFMFLAGRRFREFGALRWKSCVHVCDSLPQDRIAGTQLHDALGEIDQLIDSVLVPETLNSSRDLPR